MTVNQKELDKIDLSKNEKDSIIKIIQMAWGNGDNKIREQLAANFLKSLTNNNVKVNMLELSQNFSVEDLANCMNVAKKVDIDTLIVEELSCNC